MSGLHDAFVEIVADVPVYGDLDRAFERAERERRLRHGVVAGLAAAAAVAVAVGVLSVTGDGNSSQQPISPRTDTTPTEGTSPPATWEPPEPLRPDASRVVQLGKDKSGNALGFSDPRDVEAAEIDIVMTGEGMDFHGGSSWAFQLAARAPRDPADRVIAYGVVVDGDGDHKADCQIGINNDALEDGDFRVWVTNLRTHETTVRNGPPYGMPVEFSHPAEPGNEGYPPEMQFGFLLGLRQPDPCDPFGDPATFYAWASVTEAGQVTASDYAPDAAWLPIRWE